MNDYIKEVMRTQGAHIEAFSAAFIKEVGSEEASKYQLVETQERNGDQMTITWQFQLRPMTNPIQGVIDAMATLDAQISTIGHAAIVQQLAPIFEARPDIKSIRWDQSTPYFNDGDPCTFSVGEVYFDLGTFTQEEIDEEGFCDEEAYASEYDLNPHHDLPYGSDLYTAGSNSVKELIAPFTAIPSALMERIFGNNMKIVITRDGDVSVEDYEPDY